MDVLSLWILGVMARVWYLYISKWVGEVKPGYKYSLNSEEHCFTLKDLTRQNQVNLSFEGLGRLGSTVYSAFTFSPEINQAPN